MYLRFQDKLRLRFCQTNCIEPFYSFLFIYLLIHFFFCTFYSPYPSVQYNSTRLFCCEALDMFWGVRIFTRLSIGMGASRKVQTGKSRYEGPESKSSTVRTTFTTSLLSTSEHQFLTLSCAWGHAHFCQLLFHLPENVLSANLHQWGLSD